MPLWRVAAKWSLPNARITFVVWVISSFWLLQVCPNIWCHLVWWTPIGNGTRMYISVFFCCGDQLDPRIYYLWSDEARSSLYAHWLVFSWPFIGIGRHHADPRQCLCAHGHCLSLNVCHTRAPIDTILYKWHLCSMIKWIDNIVHTKFFRQQICIYLFIYTFAKKVISEVGARINNIIIIILQ